MVWLKIPVLITTIIDEVKNIRFWLPQKQLDSRRSPAFDVTETSGNISRCDSNCRQPFGSLVDCSSNHRHLYLLKSANKHYV